MKSNAHSVGCDIWKGGACSCGQPDRGPDIEETMSELEREIAWLREQLGLGATGAKALADAKEEIARLRKELRDCHDWIRNALSFIPDPTRKLLDLRYCIREALGE